MAERGRRWFPAVAAALALAAVAALALVIARAQALPDGPQSVIWDKQRCAECQMAVSEHAFAAQLQTEDGRVMDFDDPGCLVTYLDKGRYEVRALFFHHLREERWLSAQEVRFLRVEPTPMAYNLGAVDLGTPGTLSWEEARAAIRASNAQRKGGS